MGLGKNRLFGDIREATRRSRGFEPSRALDHLQSAFYTWSREDDRLVWSANAGYILGLCSKILPKSGHAYNAMVEPGLGMGRADAIAADAIISHPRGMPYQITYGLRLSDETLAMVDDRGRWFADRDGFPIGAKGSITVRERIEPHLPPVQIKNRSSFLAEISRTASAGGCLRNVSIVAFAVDILGSGQTDHHNTITGIYDHPLGLVILEEIINRANSLLRYNDCMLLQLDGSIALALMGCTSSDVEFAANQLRRVIEDQPLMLNGEQASVRLRIGTASAPEQASSSIQLLRCAEEAMHRAAVSQKTIAVFDRLSHSYDELAKNLMSFSASTGFFSESFLNKDLVVAYQTILEGASRFPALAFASPGRRMADCRVEMSEDLRFMAYSTGWSSRLDTHLLRLTCEDLALDPNRRAIFPVSSDTLLDPDWSVMVLAHLSERPGIASRLIIGIPGCFAVSNPVLTRQHIEKLKATDIGIALIDIGSDGLPEGFPGQWPIDLVTIDGALIQNVSASTDNRFYLRGLVDLLHDHDIAVTAMWVEDERTAALLDEWGVDYLEGRIRRGHQTTQTVRRIA